MSTVAAFASHWMGYLRAVSWQVSLLIGIIIIIERLYSKSSPLFRYWLWCLVLVRLLLPLNLIISSAIRLFPRYVGHMAYQAGEFYTAAANTIIDVSVDRIMLEPARQTLATSIMNIAVIGYCLGLLLFIAFIIAGFFKTRRFFSLCTPVTRLEILALFRKLTRELNITQTVELLSMDTDTAKIPAYSGIFHPRIVISSRIIEEWPVDELEPILLHELYHVKRCDSVVNWLQIVLQSLHFFNPLAWYANNRLRMVREELCDDRVVRHLGNGHTRYARSMLRIMEETSSPKRPGFVMIGLMGSENRIKERIGRIMKTDYTKYTRMSVRSMLVLAVMAILAIALACENSEKLTSIQSPAPEEITEKTESIAEKSQSGTWAPLAIIIEKGAYVVGGTHTTPSNLENVLTEKYNQNGILKLYSLEKSMLSKEYDFLIQALKNVGIADKPYFPRRGAESSLKRIKNTERNDSKPAEGEFESVSITILENGDYEIDSIQIPPSRLEQALTEIKERINHPRTILQIKEKVRVGGSSLTPEHELLIKTLQKVGVDIEG